MSLRAFRSSAAFALLLTLAPTSARADAALFEEAK